MASLYRAWLHPEKKRSKIHIHNLSIVFINDQQILTSVKSSIIILILNIKMPVGFQRKKMFLMSDIDIICHKII